MGTSRIWRGNLHLAMEWDARFLAWKIGMVGCLLLAPAWSNMCAPCGKADGAKMSAWKLRGMGRNAPMPEATYRRIWFERPGTSRSRRRILLWLRTVCWHTGYFWSFGCPPTGDWVDVASRRQPAGNICVCRVSSRWDFEHNETKYRRLSQPEF
ncbi:uncharacterized protein EV422DRAFT_203744 [Fimicolochytrium jonesii]|uniref:uncharacterized protein n=1 Tax=Fimicolochytrium jonesii TaxID=1396493 RepID=UPI0022FEB8D3|nr:uncharacterized protein EV422DRAFT_203744 [Fimicolochytrium jonesii]KAI8818044.1 hypothetical protein EV422DRAFT_203744 [Fimicolochytrium jonesii]